MNFSLLISLLALSHLYNNSCYSMDTSLTGCNTHQKENDFLIPEIKSLAPTLTTTHGTICPENISVSALSALQKLLTLEKNSGSLENLKKNLLAIAQKQNNNNVIELLLKNEHEQAASLAILNGDAKTLKKLLLNTKIDINKKNINGFDQSFSRTISYGCYCLLAQKNYKFTFGIGNRRPFQDVTITTNIHQAYKGYTPLAIAIANFNKKNSASFEIIKTLLENTDIDPNQTNDDGTTPLLIAIQNFNEDVFKLLLDHPKTDPNKRYQNTTNSNNGMSALYFAAEQNCPNAVKMLLENDKVDVNQAKTNGVTPLIIASALNHKEVVKLLVSNRRTDVNKKDSNGYFALYIAVIKDSQDALDALLSDERTNVNATHLDQTALLAACAKNNLACAKKLLQHPKIDPNQEGYKNFTALSLACDQDFQEIIKLLLTHPKVTVDQPNTQGITPLAIAEKNKTVLKMLQNHRSDQKKP